MIIRVKDNKIRRYYEKKAFLFYLERIKKHIEIQNMLSKYIQHGNTNVYIHSRNVAYYSFLFAKFLERRFGYRINYEILVVSAMFHDFFLYDWHETERKTKTSWV